MRWIYGIALAAALVWGLEQVAVAPLDSGELYPPFSTLRSDPLGARALYESFAALPGIAVDRLYRERSDLAPGETMFVLGVDPLSFDDLGEKELSDFEKLVQHGGRLVIGFVPIPPRRVDAEQHDLQHRWQIRFQYQPGAADGGSSMPRETALSFLATAEWRPVGNHEAVERDFGSGSIVLAADTFPLSNEGLRDARDAAFLAALAGPARQIVFDENHFGIVESGSVTTLLRKYQLQGAVAVLMLAAALFLWRSGSSFLPPRAPRDSDAVSGQDSLDGMTALLYRGVAEKDLLDTCYAEWSRSAARESRAALVEERIRAHRDPVEAYRAACGALARKESSK